MKCTFSDFPYPGIPSEISIVKKVAKKTKLGKNSRALERPLRSDHYVTEKKKIIN